MFGDFAYAKCYVCGMLFSQGDGSSYYEHYLTEHYLTEHYWTAEKAVDASWEMNR